MKVIEDSEKADFQIQHSKNKDHGNLSHHFMTNRRGKVEAVTDILLVSNITVDGDCSHEVRRQLLLGRKAMTNLDRVLKSRDILLWTKVRIVMAVVFPVVTFGCESWTIKKAECQRFDVVLKKTLESPLDCKEIKPVNFKGNQP